MKLNRTGSNWNRLERNKINENWGIIEKSVVDAEDALINSEEALDKANEAIAKSDSTQTQLDSIVIEGDSSVEAAQARVDAKGNPHTTLKERLDSEHTQVTQQLAQKVEQEDLEERNINAYNYRVVGDYNISIREGTNSTQALKALIQNAPEYSEIYLPPGIIYLDEPLVIDKYINLKSIQLGGSEDGTVLVFDNCHGIVQRKPYVK